MAEVDDECHHWNKEVTKEEDAEAKKNGAKQKAQLSKREARQDDQLEKVQISLQLK